MKKLIHMILALALCLALTACGGSGEPQKPTEPKNWIISTQYVAGKVAEFMATEDYQKMVSDFEKAFYDANLKLIVRRPYVEAAVEYYLDDPQCHLLILSLRGDFGFPDGYNDGLNIVYDIDSGFFYDSINSQSENQADKYAPFADKPQTALLHVPHEDYASLTADHILYTQYELHHSLTAEELAVVNKALGVEEPGDDILYQPLPTEAPVEEAETEAPIQEPEMEAPVEKPEAPLASPEPQPEQNDQVTVDQQFLIDAARNFQCSTRYQEIAGDPGSIRITAAFEYALSDFEGYDVHVLVMQVDGIDTDLHGFSAHTFIIDIGNGTIYHDACVDMNNWGDFDCMEDVYAAILCSPVWENSGSIWSEMETRTDLPQSMIDAANGTLTP